MKTIELITVTLVLMVCSAACSYPNIEGTWRDINTIDGNTDGQRINGNLEYVFSPRSPKSGDVVSKLYGTIILDGIGSYDFHTEAYGTYTQERHTLDIAYYPDSALVKTAFHPTSYLMGLLASSSIKDIEAMIKESMPSADNEDSLNEHWSDFKVKEEKLSFIMGEDKYHTFIKVDKEK